MDFHRHLFPPLIKASSRHLLPTLAIPKEFVSIRIPGNRRVFVKTGPMFHCCMMRGNCLQNWAVCPTLLAPEAAVLDVLWGENRELTGRNQEVWPHAPYVVQS
jgi:hypothetical protein